MPEVLEHWPKATRLRRNAEPGAVAVPGERYIRKETLPTKVRPFL